MTKHTPLPWHFFEYVDNFAIETVDQKSGLYGKQVAGIDPGKCAAGLSVTPIEEHRANAEFIALACNSHYELLEALEIALTSVEWMADATDADPEDHERLAVVQEAIRKVKGDKNV